MASSATRREPNAPVKSTPAPVKPNSRAASRNLFSTESGAFALSRVSVQDVQRAREIRDDDFERYKNFHNFFTAREEPLARAIDGQERLKRDRIDAWIADTMSEDVLLCTKEQKETKEKLVGLLMVSAALAKYGERELVRRENLGEMLELVSTRFRSHNLRSKNQAEYKKTHQSAQSDKKQVAHTVGLGFVLELVLQLPSRKRVSHEHLTEILNHNSNMRMVLLDTNQKLHKRVDIRLKSPSAPGEAESWSRQELDRLQQIVKEVQSDRFQAAMKQATGGHLYDAIRTRLKQAAPSLWDDDKDIPYLKHSNILARDRYAEKVKPQKDAQRRKLLGVKKDGTPDRRRRDNKSVPPPPAPARTTWTKPA